MFLVQCNVCCVKSYGPDASDNGWLVEDEIELCPAHRNHHRAIAATATERDRHRATPAIAFPAGRDHAVVGFDRPEPGSEQRYLERSSVRPWAAHTFWWVIHNVVAHPLIGVLPLRPAFKFHDWTSYKMHGK